MNHSFKEKIVVSTTIVSAEHSNIHAGELHWGTSPTGGRTPPPSFTFEVDFYANSVSQLRQNTSNGVTSDWAQRIEDNYALYGLDVDLVPDDVLTKKEINDATRVDSAGPVSLFDFARVNSNFHDRPNSQYLLVARESQLGYLGADWQPGLNTYFLGRALEYLGHDADPPGIAIFTDNTGHPRKTAVHEIGHSFQIGEADDSCLKRLDKGGEIYSGESLDSTPESISQEQLWSTMVSGWKQPLTSNPMNGNYFAFSLEELFTVTDKSHPPCV